jgi:hypothetical protein
MFATSSRARSNGRFRRTPRNYAAPAGFHHTMWRVMLWRLLALATTLVVTLALASSANAVLIPGPSGSLTFVESELWPTPPSTLYASSGSLQGGMSTPMVISEPGDATSEAGLGVDSAGNVVAAWNASRCYLGFNKYFACLSVPRGIWYAWKPAGGVFSAPQQLAAPAPGQGRVLVAMDSAGDVVVGYEQRGSVFIRRAHANGSFGPPVEVMSGSLMDNGTQNARLDYVGLDSQGELLIVADRDGMLEDRLGRPGRALGSPQMITPRESRSGYPYIGSVPAPVVAMGSGGDAFIAWTEQYKSGQEVQTVLRPAGGTFGPLQRLTSLMGTPHDRSWSSPTAAVVNAQGHAILALIKVAYPFANVVEVSESSASGIMSVPSALGTDGFPGPGETGVSLAENSDGETALRYGETSPAAQAIDGDPFTIDARFDASNRPFGPPKVIKSGTIGCSFAESVPPFAQPRPGCESVPTLIGAEGQAFYAVYSFPHGLGYQHGLNGIEVNPTEGMVEIQRLTQTMAGPTVELALPAITSPQPEPAPASLVDLGTSVQMDTHGRIHGHATCGNSGGRSCAITIAIEQATNTHLVLARKLLDIPAIEPHPLTITLDRSARRLLAHRHSIQALIVTSTTSNGGQATETDYPLTITPTRHNRLKEQVVA